MRSNKDIYYRGRQLTAMKHIHITKTIKKSLNSYFCVGNKPAAVDFSIFLTICIEPSHELITKSFNIISKHVF